MLNTIQKTDICSAGIKNYSEFKQADRNSPPDMDQVSLCREFIKTYLKESKKTRSSYHFKHAVERIYNQYITNGAFIMAALEEGAGMVQLREGPNALIHLSYKDKASQVKCHG